MKIQSREWIEESSSFPSTHVALYSKLLLNLAMLGGMTEASGVFLEPFVTLPLESALHLQKTYA